MVSIVVIDDQPIVRKGLCLMLEAEPDFRLVADMGNGLTVADSLIHLKPDVAVIELSLPDLHGLELLRCITRSQPHIRVVVVSAHHEHNIVAQALIDGATAYVLKTASREELIEAIRAASRGIRFLSSTLSMVNVEVPGDGQGTLPADRDNILSPREREVLYLVVQGYSSREIGNYLSISPRTVEVHRTKMMRKLNLHRHADLIRYAIREGLVRLES